MGGLFGTLNTTYTGLKTHQVMADVTSNNISNANSAHYTRQRVVAQPKNPISFHNYNLGQGVDIATIERIHNEFLFERYKNTSSSKEYANTLYENLKAASTYFPEIDGVGLTNDMKNYFNAWSSLSKNPSDIALKTDLAKMAQTLTLNLQDTQKRVNTLKTDLNKEIKTIIDEVNQLADEIGHINKKIAVLETDYKSTKANELRDKRDYLEMKITELIGGKAFKENIDRDALGDQEIADFTGDYTFNVEGFTIIDGANVHKLLADNSQSPSGTYSIFFEQRNKNLINLTSSIKQGKAGAINALSLSREQRQQSIDTIGFLEKYSENLDTFAKTLIETTNNLYSQSSKKSFDSGRIEIDSKEALIKQKYNIKEGSFNLVAYDNKGKELAKRSVQIGDLTNINDIVERINKDIDDNSDGNSLNDFDDFFKVTYSQKSGHLQIIPKKRNEEIYVSYQDNGTNFGGAIGLSKFFDGDSASNIVLNQDIIKDAQNIKAYKAPIRGNNEVALLMQQFQYDNTEFKNKDNIVQKAKITEYLNKITTEVGSDAKSAQLLNETKESVLASVKQEYSSVSEVSLDEELLNLIRIQSAYEANAKVTTTVDRMLTTLLSIKE